MLSKMSTQIFKSKWPRIMSIAPLKQSNILMKTAFTFRPSPLHFSTTFSQEKGKSFTDKLVKTLDSEIKAEESSHQEDMEAESNMTPADRDKFLSQNKWKISSKDGEVTTVLTKSTGQETLTVEFSCNPEFDRPEVSEGDENFDEEDPVVLRINVKFHVANSKGTMTFKAHQYMDTASDGATFQIEDVSYLKKGWMTEKGSVVGLFSSAEEEFKHSQAYTGPDYVQLDETLQDELANLAEEKGLTHDLGRFIISHSTDKESKEYTNWLKNLKDFLA